VLSAIYIKGFKTFARPVRMPLSGGVTAIVGPNGSGKSNITDAVLFALGEGSPSLLRAGLMNDVIFSGSDSLPPAGVAEVTLVLDNAEGRISLPYEEVSLMRRISRGGETEYRINGVRARLTDVRAAAGEAGLGRHSILRQGAVDAIVSGGAAACRNALEEAAGLGVFRRRRLAATRKLERASARLESSRRVEAELSSQLRRIEAEAVAAREYRELEARYRELSLAHLYRIAVRDLTGEREGLAGLEGRASTLRTMQESLREKERRLEAEEKKLEGRVRWAEEAIRGLENGSESLRTETLRAERTLLRLESTRNRGTHHSKLAKRLEVELGDITSKVQQLKRRLDELEVEHSHKKKEFERLEDLVTQRRAEHATAAERRARLSGELEALLEQRENVAERAKAPGALGDGEIERLAKVGEKLGTHSPEGLHARATAVLDRLEELRSLAAGMTAEANRRRGMLATLVGSAEAEIRTLRAPERATDGATTRLYEILRPRPGYEAAVEAALGDLADGVLAKTLDEGMRLLSGDSPERVVVRLDAEGVPENGSLPGKPLLECVEVMDPSCKEALKRLLGGTYVLERADHVTPKRGYDVAVTREGLRFTRTSASRRTPGGDFARRASLEEEEKRLYTLKNQLGEELYDMQGIIFSAYRCSSQLVGEAETLASLISRTSRVTSLLASEAGRRLREAEAARERRWAEALDLHEVETKSSAIETELQEAREAEERAKEELATAVPAVDSSYTAARETAGQLARARTDLQEAREHRDRVSRGLASLENTRTAGDNTHLENRSRRVVECARRFDAIVRERLARLRHSRSDAAERRDHAVAEHAGLARQTGDLAGELARVSSAADTLRVEVSRAEEASVTAEGEISEEWGATLEIARASAASFPENPDTERERARLARRLKHFGDVNLLAISQEGQLRERYEFVTVQRADAEAAATEIARIIQNVDEEIESRFEATFREVRTAFSSLVPRMMEGAAGELDLSEEGVEIGLRLKGRGWRPLRMLSGGERSLLALSFLFSIFLGRFGAGSKAFCMLDEAEAALDDLNLARFLTVVDSYRADGQFLLVTHQKRTMAAADVLYGVAPDASGATVVVSKRLTGD
jgi:chromosome segregation protein